MSKKKRNTVLVNIKRKENMLPIHNFVLHHCFTIEMLVKIIVCHEDMTGKRGENVMGISIFPFRIEL